MMLLCLSTINHASSAARFSRSQSYENAKRKTRRTIRRACVGARARRSAHIVYFHHNYGGFRSFNMGNKDSRLKDRNDRTMQAYRALSQVEIEHHVGCRTATREPRKRQQKRKRFGTKRTMGTKRKMKRCSPLESRRGV